MSVIETIGINVVAPILSILTAGVLFWTGRMLLQASKSLNELEYRVQTNEEDIDELWNHYKNA